MLPCLSSEKNVIKVTYATDNKITESNGKLYSNTCKGEISQIQKFKRNAQMDSASFRGRKKW